MTQPHRFAIATREESRSESRVIHGQLEERDGRIEADDRADAELLERCERLLASLREHCDGASRFVASARRLGAQIVESAHAIVTIAGLRIVTDAAHARADLAWLESVASEGPFHRIDTHRGIPMLWRRGSGSVLLHEAAGHPAEKRQPPVEWPEWLRAHDVPEGVDDTGAHPSASDLLAGETPRALRRESFVHPALPRMSHVAVEQAAAPFALPVRRIDIHVVAGGFYEALSDMVSIVVVGADLVDGNDVRRLEPFAIQETRAAVARSLTGARGHSERYPGVICSNEGQQLFVGSEAPELLTVF